MMIHQALLGRAFDLDYIRNSLCQVCIRICTRLYNVLLQPSIYISDVGFYRSARAFEKQFSIQNFNLAKGVLCLINEQVTNLVSVLAVGMCNKVEKEEEAMELFLFLIWIPHSSV